MAHVEPLLTGESIVVTGPLAEDLEEWANWFNRKDISNTLFSAGLFPSSEMTQALWLQTEIASGRFIGMIREREGCGALLGVTSISSIDWRRRTGEVATVIGKKSAQAPLAGLESRALVSQHAFETLGLNRLGSAQLFPENERWSEAMALIGWFFEGFRLEAQWTGRKTDNLVLSSALQKDYEVLTARRSGKLWPGIQEIRRKLSEIPDPGWKPGLSDRMDALNAYRMKALDLV